MVFVVGGGVAEDTFTSVQPGCRDGGAREEVLGPDAAGDPPLSHGPFGYEVVNWINPLMTSAPE